MTSERAVSISRRGFLTGAGAVSLGGAVGSVSALYTDEGLPRDRPAVVGHRGAAALAPPNTLAGIRRALEHGVDGVALDVRRTADGRLVLFHDPILDWSTDGHGRVRGTAWDRLADVEIGGEPIPTLAAAFDELADEDVEVYLEAKRVGYTGDIVDLADRYGLRDRVTVTSFRRPALAPARERGVRTGLLGIPPNPKLIDEASARGASAVASHYVPHTVQWFVEEARDAGLSAGVWHLAETRESLRDTIEADPDFVVTNRPDLARRLLDDG